MRASLFSVFVLAACGRLDFKPDARPDVVVDSVARACDGLDVPTDCISPMVYACGDTCHLSCANQVNFSFARLTCAAWGGCVARLIDQPAHDCVAARLVDSAWIGLTQAASTTSADGWSWCDGTPLAYSAWRQGEPNGGGSENCAYIEKATTAWIDAPCGTTTTFVCTRPL